MEGNPLKKIKPLWIIGIIEILIGGITLFVTFFSLVFSIHSKPGNVLLFVMITGIISFSLGCGLLKGRKWAYDLLVYFSSVIILSKILIFTQIINLNHALETTIPSPLKNLISIVYHCVIIFYLKKEEIKSFFESKIQPAEEMWFFQFFP